MRQRAHVWAVVPVKAFTRAKSRLAQVLSVSAREAFARQLLEHVLRTVRASAGIAELLVVTDDEQVASHAARFASQVLRDPLPSGQPLSRVVDAGLSRVAELGAAAAVVCMADLPELSSRDLSDVLSLLESHDVVIAPDHREQGTNLLALAPPLAMPSCFGSGDSFARHLALAERHALRVAVHRAPGLCFDVDGPSELLRL